MFISLYPISFLVSLGALTFWFYFKDNELKSNLLRKLFFASLAVFGASFLFNQGEWDYKFLMLGREMVVLMAVPLFLSFFRKNKIAFLALMFAILGTMDYFYFEKLKTTYPQHISSSESTLALDKNGELLIEVLDDHKIAEIKSLLDKYGLTAKTAFNPMDKAATDLDDYYVIDIPAKEEANFSKIKKALAANKYVEWVEANEQYSLSPLETIPQKQLTGLNKKYGLNDPGINNLWGFEEMNVNELYEVLKNSKPKKRALIAILDTGVDAGHEDLKANFKSTKSKYNNDPAGHGTHCAGIAAAVSNNHKGVASFSQNNEFVNVTSIKVLMGGGFGTQKMIIDGMLEAADNGADVLSLSLGGLSNDSRQRAYKKAVDYVNKKGAIVVVAAGNSNRNANEFAPANTPGVITVSAIDTLLNRASFSNFVNDLDKGIAAPGVNIYSTFPKSEYRTFNGTSMATPYVAGLVGLMKSLKPNLSTKETYNILNKTGKKTNDTVKTGKLIQPGSAIKELIKTKQDI